MLLSSLCSPLLKPYVKNRFGPFEIQETKATCGDCVCSKKVNPSLPYYDPHLKCCTFHPFLANFTVGALLSEWDQNHFVCQAIERKIAQHEYSLPLGLFAPVPYQVAFNQRQPNDFGQKKDFLCPYFDRTQNQCGAWAYRGPICTSYYCVSDYGPAGMTFWEMWGDYLHHCEMVLAQDCLVSLGLPHELIDYQLEYLNCEEGTEEELASPSMPMAHYKNLWSAWPDSPESFYKACFSYVKSLSFKQLEELFGEELQEGEKAIAHQMKAISDLMA